MTEEWTVARLAADDPVRGDDGYPHDIELARIRTWPLSGLADYEAVIPHLGVRWSYPDRWHKEVAKADFGDRMELRYTFSTGGWSGNEDLVAAIEGNQMLQVIGAYSWQRGGHYEYRFPMDH
jgi:hypothetical protein